MSFPYEVDGRTYLDRARRMRAATHMGGKVIRPDEIRAILAEVPPVPFEAGRSYRIRVLAGEPVPRHLHGIDEHGVEHALDTVDLAALEWRDFVGTYLGRFEPEHGALVGLLAFGMEDGQLAALADIDILRAEEA